MLPSSVDSPHVVAYSSWRSGSTLHAGIERAIQSGDKFLDGGLEGSLQSLQQHYAAGAGVGRKQPALLMRSHNTSLAWMGS